MEVLIAFFGILYLLCRRGVEKTADFNVKYSREQNKKRYEEWVSKVVNKDVEKEVDEYLNNPDNKPEIRAKLYNIFSNMPIEESVVDYMVRCGLWAKHILLAERGCITENDALWGIRISTQNKEKYGDIYILRWIDKTLKANGMNETLYGCVLDLTELHHKWVPKDIYSDDVLSPSCYLFYWEPRVRFYGV